MVVSTSVYMPTTRTIIRKDEIRTSMLTNTWENKEQKHGKCVPLHAMEAYGGEEV
jgi:hypothetical protein